jgi:Fe-S oxidoreductase
MLKPMSMIKTLRANLAEEGILPKNIKEVFDLTNLYRNVWGKPKETRIKWAEGLNVNHVSQVENLDYLIFLDCASAYIERNQETARKFVEILNNVGISYGFLGPDEACDGNDILMMGEEGLFEDLANENIHKIKEYNIKKIITLSPHSYNALKNLYPQIDEDFNVDVVHYTQFLSNLIKSKRLKPKKILGKTATYHDPCYLGRHNAIYDEPRDILNNILLSPIKEMFYCKDKSICCGGGGGGLWIEKEDGIIMEQIRILHALELNVDVLVTACPFCTQQFETAKEDLNASIEIKDIIELVFESL